MSSTRENVPPWHHLPSRAKGRQRQKAGLFVSNKSMCVKESNKLQGQMQHLSQKGATFESSREPMSRKRVATRAVDASLHRVSDAFPSPGAEDPSSFDLRES